MVRHRVSVATLYRRRLAALAPPAYVGGLFEERLDRPSELELNVGGHRRLHLEVAGRGGGRGRRGVGARAATARAASGV